VATPQSPLSSLYPSGYPACVIAGSAANLRLFIPGKPIPKGRHRSRIVNPKQANKSPWVQHYPDEATATWEERVLQHVQLQLRLIGQAGDDEELRLPFKNRVLITLRFNFERPKSTPKRVRYPVQSRTDLDNLEKAIYDALQNARVLVNDNIITDNANCKRYADDNHPEGVEIDLTALL
jgi:Holliday junction resolvase RusA-like endonuclease